MKILFFQSLFSLNCMALSWLCDYSEIDGPITTHVLYKEETYNIVKWLEKYEYCRAKGDPSVYEDAGQAKCEYSRNLCVFSNYECIFNQERENDPLNECQDLLYNNILSDELDSGRIPSETESEETVSDETESDYTETDETVSDETASDETVSEETESEETESEETESDETESYETESDYTESEETESDETESDYTESEETESDETESDETESDEVECTETVETAVEVETETVETVETAETESIVYSSAKLSVKSLLLLFSFPFFM